MEVTREQALRFRYDQQRLAGAGPPGDCPLLDLGVQDTGGPHAAQWALHVRGCEVDDADPLPALRRIDEWDGTTATVPAHLDPIRAVLRLMGPTTPKLVAGYQHRPPRRRPVRPRDRRDVAAPLEGRPAAAVCRDVGRPGPPRRARRAGRTAGRPPRAAVRRLDHQLTIRQGHTR